MYEQYTDEEVIELIRSKDEQALDFLINKYRNLVKIRSRAYFIIGADSEDIIQEGMLGLYKAILKYKQTDSSFHTFARLCIDRQLITAIKSANRKKHIPLNSYLSLNVLAHGENSDVTYFEKIQESKNLNPEDLLIDKENVKQLQIKIDELLSSFEKNVLYLYLQGKSYNVIAENLKKGEKSIDNAIQRIRKKISKIIY